MGAMKRYLRLAALAMPFLGMPVALWALCPAVYNRPTPMMDYVPQEIGIYDTQYSELNENDCRGCHGNSTADRHHFSETARGGQCTPCHEIIPDPPGVVVIRDCVTPGCHATFDNGWHHLTDMAAAENCVACHGRQVVDEITPFRDHQMYPPTVVTPTPFSCENCHWEQSHSATGNPDNPGHPSTYDHYDPWGNFVGFFEYSRPVYGNFDTHHMGWQGFVAGQCYKCHSQDPQNPEWDPYDPEIMRYCEICHNVGTLHTIGPHVEYHSGWQAVGFHVPGHPGEFSCDDYDPTAYRTWSPTGPYAPETTPGFTPDEQCLGCHGDDLPPWDPPVPPCPPVIDTGTFGIQPNHGCCGVMVTLRGQCFGAEHLPGFSVQIRAVDPTPWFDVFAIHAWTDTLIEFEIPCYFLAPGNYYVRVKTPAGVSNSRVFTVEGCPSLLTIDPLLGPCGTWIKFFGEIGDFGPAREQMFDSYYGVRRVVDFKASSGTYTIVAYTSWNEDSKERSFRVAFYYFFEDGVDPNTGQRNFVRDDGSSSCPEEPMISRCEGLTLGLYSAYVKAIYFGDEDSSGGLSCGDTIFQVAKSDPVYFELTNEPIIYKLNPREIERSYVDGYGETHMNVVRIFGHNFGPTQEFGDEVRIGSVNQYLSDPFTLGFVQNKVQWASTLIKAAVVLPPSAEGKTGVLWVIKDGMVTNAKLITILAPLP